MGTIALRVVVSVEGHGGRGRRWKAIAKVYMGEEDGSKGKERQLLTVGYLTFAHLAAWRGAPHKWACWMRRRGGSSHRVISAVFVGVDLLTAGQDCPARHSDTTRIPEKQARYIARRGMHEALIATDRLGVRQANTATRRDGECVYTKGT